LLTGRYFHNIKMPGNTVMHVNYTFVNANTFARTLKEKAGYTTGLFGKYVNSMPKSVPPGFDAWLANAGGDYVGPHFQTKNIDGLPDGGFKFSNSPGNYSTSVIGNISINWIKKVAKQGKPFFAYIAPKAAHEPFDPPTWYRDHWDPSWPQHEPRGENWNCSAESRRNHHGNIPKHPLITSEASKVITGVFKNRWRTLMAVDDLIGELVRTIDELGLSDSTYFFYSSDHGFQLGQFNILMDKRLVYEWDVKIHLLVRGPGVKPGSSFAAPGTQVDIAPTLLGLAGLTTPTSMDGKSIVPFIVDPAAPLLESTRSHLVECGGLKEYSDSWRKEVFLEYYFNAYNVKCAKKGGATPLPHNYPKSDSWCTNLKDNSDCWTSPDGTEKGSDCYETEDPSNNYIALRRFENGVGTLYAEFQTGNEFEKDIKFDQVDFVEHFHVAKDPWQMKNLANDSSLDSQREELHERLQRWFRCAGPSCRDFGSLTYQEYV
jgi:N-acetylglucosamine-6-sulfatase